jgi:hypothetical protein
MEWYNLIFFHVFKFYFKDGNYKNDVPWFTAASLISTSFWVYFFSSTIIITSLFNLDGFQTENRPIFISSGFIFLFANIFWFKGSDRYLKIYKKYRNSPQDIGIISIISWVIVIGGFLSLTIILFL